MNIVEVKDLAKTFTSLVTRKQVHALRGVDLSVEKGMIFGLLGPNGAGKTTLVKILLGICYSTRGKAWLFDEPVERAASRDLTGYLPESHKYPRFLKGKHVMDYYAKLSGMAKSERVDRIDNLLLQVRMQDWATTKMGKYSKGMQQRVGLAAAMVSDPELLVLDEPTDGVDPIGRKEIRDVLLELKDRGKTIFLNSHLLSEVELICDHIAILNEGKIVSEGSVEELTKVGNIWSVTLDQLPDNFEKRFTDRGMPASRGDGNELLLEAPDISGLNSVIDAIRNEGLMITGIVRKRKTLEDMFIDVIYSENNGGVKC